MLTTVGCVDLGDRLGCNGREKVVKMLEVAQLCDVTAAETVPCPKAPLHSQ